MPFGFSSKKVKPEDEEKPDKKANHTTAETQKESPKDSLISKDTTATGGSSKPEPKEDEKKDQTIDALDQTFVSSVGVDTSGNISETKANTPLQNDRSNIEVDKDKDGPDPNEIFQDEDRPRWNTRFDFLICMIGFALDISNVWRFPWLCFKHRGLIFLVPYTIVLVLCVFPVFYLELIIGQFVRKGVIGVWRICPIFKGVGYATVFITYSMVYSYNIVLTWTLHFAIESWSSPMPWTTCQNEWNTEDCIEINQDVEQTQRKGKLSGYEYFHGETLQHYDPRTNTTYSIVNIGEPVTKNYIYLTIIYMLLIIFLVRGLKNIALDGARSFWTIMTNIIAKLKVMWYASGLFFVILLIMVFRGVSLPGSYNGLKYLVQVPSLQKLADMEMWIDASTQVLHSTGLGFGVHLTFASLNSFHHNILRDCIIVLSVNVIASCISLIAVFGFIGCYAFLLRTPIREQTFRGVDILFDIFPDALARLPANKFFAFAFFMMIFLLSFASVLAAFQVVIMSLKDDMNNNYKSSANGCKTCVITTIAVVTSYGFGLVTLTQGGYDLYTTIDDNVATSSLLLCTFLHIIGISWFYGVDNVCRAVYAMYGSVPNIVMRIAWKFIAPSILLILIVGDAFYSTRFTDPGTPRPLKLALGTAITWFPMLICFMAMIIVVFRMKGPRKCVCLISPDLEHETIRKNGKAVRTFFEHWKFIGSKKEMEGIVQEIKNTEIEDPAIQDNQGHGKVAHPVNGSLAPHKNIVAGSAVSESSRVTPPSSSKKSRRISKVNKAGYNHRSSLASISSGTKGTSKT